MDIPAEYATFGQPNMQLWNRTGNQNRTLEIKSQAEMLEVPWTCTRNAPEEDSGDCPQSEMATTWEEEEKHIKGNVEYRPNCKKCGYQTWGQAQAAARDWDRWRANVAALCPIRDDVK